MVNPWEGKSDQVRRSFVLGERMRGKPLAPTAAPLPAGTKPQEKANLAYKDNTNGFW